MIFECLNNMEILFRRKTNQIWFLSIKYREKVPKHRHDRHILQTSLVIVKSCKVMGEIGFWSIVIDYVTPKTYYINGDPFFEINLIYNM